VIPNFDKAKESINAVTGVINNTESLKVKRRRHKDKHPLKVFKHSYTKGYCVMCKSKEKIIWDKKHSLCKACKAWCKTRIEKIHGCYKKQYVSDMIVEFQKPVKCRFHSICGNTLSRLEKVGKIRKRYICERCYPIYWNGYETAKRHLQNRRRKSC
jgi:hypothetical protein